MRPASFRIVALAAGGAALVLTLAAAPAAAATDALELLRRGHTAFRAGDYPAAAAALEGIGDRLPRSRDYVIYLLAESEFYAGRPARARALFAELGRRR